MFDTLRNLISPAEEEKQHDDPMVHIEYPQPFMQIVDGYSILEVKNLKRTLEAKRRELKMVFEELDPESDRSVRLYDKMKWMWRKIIYCDTVIVRHNNAEQVAKDARKKAALEAEAAQKAEKEARRLAHEAMLKEHSKKKATAPPVTKIKITPDKSITHMAIWYNTQRDGEMFEITTHTDMIEWWLQKIEKLSENEQDQVPMDLRPRSITAAQFERLPQWMRDKVKSISSSPERKN